MYSLLLLSLLLHVTTCTVYTVTPDDHYYPNTTCHHCHNLQHYLLNVTKYFTSNTQLLFLPGLHHLRTDLIIQMVHNISLIGSTANGTTLDTVIQLMTCTKCISVINVTKLTIRNIKFNDDRPSFLIENLLIAIQDSSFILLHHLTIYQHQHNYTTLVIINVLGNSFFDQIDCFGGMQLIYNETHTKREHHSLSLNNCTINSIHINMYQVSYKVRLTIINLRVQVRQHVYMPFKSFIHAEELGINEMVIINCDFLLCSYDQPLLFSSTGNASVQFDNCQFIVFGDIWEDRALMKLHERI